MTTLAQHPAHWAPLPRRALHCLALLACAASGMGWALPAGQQLRDAARQHLQTQRQQLLPALARAASLPALRAQHGQLSMQVATQAEQLWHAQDVPLLRLKLNRRATECSLVLASFRPLADTHGHGAELTLHGHYAGLRCFVAHITQPPRAVLFQQLDISPRDPTHDMLPTLTLQASVRLAQSTSPLAGDNR